MNAMSNPFSTRYTGLGRIPYLGVEAEQWSAWLDEWSSQGRVFQVVGQHGSGKSTLALDLAFRLAERLEASSGQRPWIRHQVVGTGAVRSRLLSSRLEDDWGRLPSHGRAGICVVDGLERLSWFQRCAVVRHHRRRGWPLLVTSHRALAGIPVLTRTTTRAEDLDRLVRHLAGTWDTGWNANGSQQLFDRHAGNLRECLMELYDRFAQRPIAVKYR